MISFAKFIPYSTHLSDKIIKLQDGSYLMAFKIDGLQSIGKEQEDIDERMANLCRLYNGFKAPTRFNIYTHSHLVRYYKNPVLDSDFNNDFAKALDDEYVENQIHESTLMVTEFFLTIIYRPYRMVEQKGIKLTSAEDFKKIELRAIDQLGNIEVTLKKFLRDYQIETLSTYEKKGIIYSEVLEYLGLLINGHYKRVPVLNAPINTYLATSSISYGNSEVLALTDYPYKAYACVLAISEYPTHTKNNCLKPLLNLGIRLSISQLFMPMDKIDAISWLKRTRKAMISSNSATSSEINQINDAIDGVNEDKFVMGEYSFNIIIYADNVAELKEFANQAKSALSESSLVATIEPIAKVHSFFSQLPGNYRKKTRKAVLSSENIVNVMPFIKESKGKAKGNPWGPAISILRTTSNEAFYFNFHSIVKEKDRTGELDPGATFICGMTGVGKTTILNFLIAQSLRVKKKPRVILFDKDLGSAPFIKALGGKYVQLRLGQPSGLNPFQVDYTKSNLASRITLVKELTRDLQAPHSARDHSDIEHAVTQVLKEKNKSIKRLQAVYNLLPKRGDDGNSVRSRLAKWVGGGSNAWLFDNEEDKLSMENSEIFGLDYTEFLSNEEIISPTLMYLIDRTEEIIKKYRTILSMDEVWKAFLNPVFCDYIDDKVRTIRKLDGVPIFSTQSPKDYIHHAPNSFLEQMTTRIFLPNPAARLQDYTTNPEDGKGLGLTVPMYKSIKRMPLLSRQFMVIQQADSAHCSLDLSGVKAVDILSGNEDRALLAEELIEEKGENWIEHYYQSLKTIKKIEV